MQRLPRFVREYRGEVPGCPGGVGAYGLLHTSLLWLCATFLVSFASPCLVYAYGFIAIILLAHTFSFFCNVYNSILLSLNLVYAEIIRKLFL